MGLASNKAESVEEFSPFIMSESLPVAPTKLVKRIVRGEFVDMAKLLKHNMEADRMHSLAEGETSKAHIMQRANRREIPDLLSLLQCFTYMQQWCAAVSRRKQGRCGCTKPQ